MRIITITIFKKILIFQNFSNSKIIQKTDENFCFYFSSSLKIIKKNYFF